MKKPFCVMTLVLTIALGPQLLAQVQTDVPAVIPGAKPVTVEHIKIHGQSLEGNLEGDAVDRDVLVFLPPSYAKREVPPLSGRLRVTRFFHRRRAMEPRDPRAANDRRSIRSGRERNDRRAARFQDRTQRLDVFEFGYYR